MENSIEVKAVVKFDNHDREMNEIFLEYYVSGRFTDIYVLSSEGNQKSGIIANLNLLKM